MIDRELYLAAIHEAGHVVLASVLDFCIDGMEVFLSEQGRWFGKVLISLAKEENSESPSLSQLNMRCKKWAIVAVAGVLAQAKDSAGTEHGIACRFCYVADLREAVLFFKDKTRTDDDPGILSLRFVDPSTSDEWEQDIVGSNFGAVDRNSFRKNIQDVFSASPELIIQEAMRLLDDPKYWQQVNELATTLVNQEPSSDDQRRVLTSEQISKVLSKDSI